MTVRPTAEHELENLLADDQVQRLPARTPSTPPRLTVELVPETCWYSNVRSELSRAEWDLIRRQVYQTAGYRCEICTGHGPRGRLHCHEVWDYDDHTLAQRLDRMIALCPNCHEVKHIGHANTVGRCSHARAWLAQVNHWTPDRVDAYLAQQGELWLHRSRHQWRLDLTTLTRYGVTPPSPTPPVDPELVRFDACAEPPAIGQVIVHHELGVVICEQILGVDRSYGTPITTVLARPAEPSTWRSVVEELETREQDGTFALDWIEPRYVEYLIDQAIKLTAG